MNVLRHCWLLLLAATLSGCLSYTIVQRNVFADDDGNIVSVEYGRSERDHVNTFVSPVTGKEMEFKSKLMVIAHLPDGDSFKAWQSMNFLPRGTMYKSDNEKWQLLANGFSCIIYYNDDGKSGEYREIYRGVLCDIDSNTKVEKNDKWKDVVKPGREYKKPSQRTK